MEQDKARPWIGRLGKFALTPPVAVSALHVRHAASDCCARLPATDFVLTQGDKYALAEQLHCRPPSWVILGQLLSSHARRLVVIVQQNVGRTINPREASERSHFAEASDDDDMLKVITEGRGYFRVLGLKLSVDLLKRV